MQFRSFMKFIAFAAITTITSNVAAKQWVPKHQDADKQEKKILTPISKLELVDVLNDSYTKLHGKEPNDNTLAMAWAQVALENSQGRIVWNHNLGNIGNAFDKHQKWYLHSRETYYRSFDSFEESATTYWSVVGRCEAASIFFKNGQPREAAHALKACNYYGAPEPAYANVLFSLYWLAKTKFVKIFHEKKLKENFIKSYENNHMFTSICGCSLAE